MSFSKMIAIILACSFTYFAQAQATFDPLSPALKFSVFSGGNVLLRESNLEGPVAAGGQIVVLSSNIATSTSGYYPTNQDNHSDNLALVGDSNIAFSGRSFSYLHHGEVRLKGTGTFQAYYVDENNNVAPFRIANGGYNNTPALRSAKVQIEGSLTQPSGIDFPAALTQLKANSIKIDGLKTGGDPSKINYITIPAGNDPHILLQENKLNYINLTGNELYEVSTRGSIIFDNTPSATRQLVFNITSNIPQYFPTTSNFVGLTDESVAYTLFNFTNINSFFSVTNNNLSYGQILAPWAEVSVSETVDRSGQVISAYCNVEYGTMKYLPANLSFPDPSVVLPISGLSLQATKLAPSLINITWNMANQNAIKSYTLERSYDGLLFSEIYKIEKSNISHMQFNDATDKSGHLKVFYRVKVSKITGSIEYSDVLKVNLSGTQHIALSPNPAKDFINVNFHAAETNVAKVSIITANGKIVQEKKINLQKGMNSFQCTELGKLPAGTYILRVQESNFKSISESFIIN